MQETVSIVDIKRKTSSILRLCMLLAVIICGVSLISSLTALWNSFPSWAVMIVALLILAGAATFLPCPRLPALVEKYFVVFLLAVFFFSRLVWILLTPTQPISDFQTYHLMAASLAAGEGTGSFGGVVNGLGYPLTLSGVYLIFGSSPWVGKAFTLLLGMLSLGLLYWLGWETCGSTQARMMGLLFVCWPGQLTYSSVLASEHLALALGLAALAVLQQGMKGEEKNYFWYFSLGFLLTLGFVTRPTMVVYIFSALAALLMMGNFSRRAWKEVLLVLAALAVTYGLYFLAIKIWNLGDTPDFGRGVALNLVAGTDFSTRGLYQEDVHGEWIRSVPADQVLLRGLERSWQQVLNLIIRFVFIC